MIGRAINSPLDFSGVDFVLVHQMALTALASHLMQLEGSAVLGHSSAAFGGSLLIGTLYVQVSSICNPCTREVWV